MTFRYLQTYFLRGIKVWSLIVLVETRVYSFIGHVELKKINFQKISQNIFDVLCYCALCLPSAWPHRRTVQPHWSIQVTEPRFWTPKCSWKIWTKVQWTSIDTRYEVQGWVAAIFREWKLSMRCGTNFVIGFGKQVHFSQRISRVIRNITKPQARNTRNRDSVLKVHVKVLTTGNLLQSTYSGMVISCMMYKLM